jgi:hypothetical protein
MYSAVGKSGCDPPQPMSRCVAVGARPPLMPGARRIWQRAPPSRSSICAKVRRGSARLLDDDHPCIQFGEIDADTTLTRTWTHVNRGSVLRFTQPSLQLRLRLMTDRALVRRRRTFVGDPHGEPSRHRFEPRLERRHLRPATLMRLAAGAGREAQERIFIIQDGSALTTGGRGPSHRGVSFLSNRPPFHCSGARWHPLRLPHVAPR